MGSMSERKRTLAKLTVGSDDELYLLTTAIGEDGEEGFELALCDGVNGWTGSLDENDLETLSHDVKMNYSDYTAQTRKALTRVNLGSLNFVYQTKKQKDGSLLLIWKKHMMAENIKFQLGSVKLKSAADPTEITLMLFNEAIAAAGDLQSTISTLRTENERMATERANALKRLDKCVTAKEELENDLFSKFAIVVNDKKAKIRELKNEVEDLRNGVPSSSPGPSSSRNSHSRGRGDAADEADEDIGVASDYNTDEETPSPAKKRGRKPANVKNEPVSQDDSLMLGTGDDILPSTGKRRRREATKKSTPSKAVLPKVSSTPKAATPSTSRASRPTSMKKSASNTSNVSSDQLDPDEMIHDMF